MKNAMQFIIHLGFFLTYVFTVHYACNHLHIPMLANAFKKFDAGQVKYLTVWNVLGQRSLSGTMAQEILLVAFHVLNCLQFAFAVHYDYTYVVIPRSAARADSVIGGKFKFLTFWNAILQTVFFLICLMNDIFGTNAVSPKKKPLIRRLKDYVHATLSFPVSMFVGVTFWALMFVDRELVLPKAVDPYFPSWLNHLMHTMIMISTVVEMVMAPRTYPTRSQGLFGLTGFMLTYLIWMHVVYFKSGVWVYPVMEVLNFPLRMGFFVVLLLFCTILYIVGEKLDSALWRKDAQQKQSHSKTK